MSTIGQMRAYLAGVLHGDGWCTKLTFGLRVKDRDFAAMFSVAVEEVTGFKMSVRWDNYWVVRGRNRTGRFSELKSYNPVDNSERSAWLRGLFDSEGNAQILHRPKIGLNSYQRRVAIYSTDLATLRIAAGYLHALGIRHAIRLTKNSASHKGTKPVSELRLCRREAFQAFAVLVGSSIGRKQAALQRIAATYQKDPSASARAAQLKGAATRRARMLNVSLPSVISGIRAFIKAGATPTMRACSAAVDGHQSMLHHFRHSELLAMAQGGD